MAKSKTNASAKPEKARKYLSQADVPTYSLTKALRVPMAISDSYGKHPTKPLRVAQAMDMTPTSGPFRALCGAAIAYGLTEGGCFADVISLTPLAKRILSPTEEGADLQAKREATLKPRVIREFLSKYNDSKLPSESIAVNVLEEIGVPREKTKDVLALIMESARDVGFLREVKGSLYVDLEGVLNSDSSIEQDTDVELAAPVSTEPDVKEIVPAPVTSSIASQVKPPSNRVFITHGRNKEIVAQIKELLTFGSFQPIVSIEQETVSKPVPDKVMDDMRSCSAAIVHVGAEMKVIDSKGDELSLLNPNVLIEIRCGRRSWRWRN